MQLTPKQIVAELDRYIIGQQDAKKAVAVALRNRERRRLLPSSIRDEIAPKNIIMIGPTGVGKTEIARRVARLVNAPFIKVEATKFTEVGYVGRDVESMIRELTNLAVSMVKEDETKKVERKAEKLAQERILDILFSKKRKGFMLEQFPEVAEDDSSYAREKVRRALRDGALDEKVIEIDVKQNFSPILEIFSGAGIEGVDLSFVDTFTGLFPQRTRRRRTTVAEAKKILAQEEAQKLVDMDQIIREALQRVQECGIIFLDEIDKIISKGVSSGPDVSREGVQRDLLPIVEGSAVNTKYGIVRTDHILFIAAGTFSNCKPSDLIPELQGRFPIRVELSSLGKEEFVRILREPENALIRQYKALLGTEGITLEFTDGAVEKIAEIATWVNDCTENIGARRLHTVMEKLLEDLLYEAPHMQQNTLRIDVEYVERRLSGIAKDRDLSRYIL